MQNSECRIVLRKVMRSKCKMHNAKCKIDFTPLHYAHKEKI